MVSEIWLPIPGYEEFYSVSNLGRIRSNDWSFIRADGGAFNKKGRVLRQNTEHKGYKSVRLSLDRIHKIFKVHRLVALAFIRQPLDGEQVNHKNGIKDDNRPENLEWVSGSENMIHAFGTGLHSGNAGERNPRAILTEDDVRNIRKLSAGGMTAAAISRKYGVSDMTIRQILKRRNWAWLV